MTVSALIQKAVKKIGSQKKLGEACGCSQNKIWLAITSEHVDAELALGIHHATDGDVAASELRPDLWSAPEHVPVREAAQGVA